MIQLSQIKHCKVTILATGADLEALIYPYYLYNPRSKIYGYMNIGVVIGEKYVFYLHACTTQQSRVFLVSDELPTVEYVTYKYGYISGYDERPHSSVHGTKILGTYPESGLGGRRYRSSSMFRFLHWGCPRKSDKTSDIQCSWEEAEEERIKIFGS